MKDLDFDELDRAVNSVVTGKPANNDAGVADSTTPVVDDTAEPTNLTVDPAKPTAPPLAARRSSGQFMDVVHPSSDMRRPASATPDQTPTTTSYAPNPDVLLPVSVIPIPEAPQKDMPTSVLDQTPPIPTEEPNPIVGVNDSTSVPPDDDSDIDRISDDITDALGGQESVEPLESPFIAGTKVEKRPLGAFSDKPAIEIDNSMEVSTDEPTDEVKSSIEPGDFETNEAQNDFENAEIGTTDKPEPNIVEPEPTTETQPNAMVEENGPVSIVQQYKEQPSTGDQTTGAIYDTDTYHKALIKPIKKKSIWLWALLVIGLVVLGAAAGAAVYFFAIPRPL